MKSIISGYQATLILIFTLLATSIVFLPSLIISQANQDAWISVILLVIIFLFISFIYQALCKKMGRKDLVNFTREVFGEILTIPFALYIIISFIILSGVVVRETSEVMKTAYLPQTPLWFFNITLILVSSYVAFLGLEVIGRSLEVLFYILLFFFLIYISLLISDLSFEFIKPIGAQGIDKIWNGIFPGITFFGEIFIILILAPHLTQKGRVLKPLIFALLIGGSIFFISILVILMLFGPEFSKNLTIPLITAFSYVKKFRVIERLDPLFIFIWISSGIFKISIFIYVSVYTLQKWLNFSTYHIFIPLILPPLYYFSSHFFENTAVIIDFLYRRIPYSVILLILYPIILLIVSWIRGIDFSE